MSMTELWKLVQESASLVILIGTPLFGWLIWCLRREFVKRDECERYRKEIGDRQSALESQQSVDASQRGRLSQSLNDMPTSKDFNDVRLSLNTLAGNMNALQKQMEGQAEILKIVKDQGDTVHKYLLNKGK